LSLAGEPMPAAAPEVAQSGIVSVNSRGASGGNVLGKVFFTVGVIGLLIVAGLYGLNHYRAQQAAKAGSAQKNHTNESKPAQAGPTRHFEDHAPAVVSAAGASDAPPLPGAAGSLVIVAICSLVGNAPSGVTVGGVSMTERLGAADGGEYE